MKLSYRIGKLFGIPIKIHITLVIFLALFLFSKQGIDGFFIMVAIFSSVLVHELGHALLAKSLGLPIVDISLYPFGGMARMAAPPKTTADEIKVAIIGPIVSLILAGGFWLLAFSSQQPMLGILAQINLILGAFNLLPALPMDGGRIFRALLARKIGFYKATILAAKVARTFAVIMIILAYFYSIWLLVLAAFLLIMSLIEQASATARVAMGDPGYQDLPNRYHSNQDPYEEKARPEGFKVPGSDWEVVEPQTPDPND
jgi:Zn-dependent protease